MKIALNMCALRGQGSALIGRNVLSEMLQIGAMHEFRLWIPEQWSPAPWASGPLRQVFTVAGGWRHKLWAENVHLRRTLRREPHDRLFSLGDTSLPRSGVPHLLLVQTSYLAYARSELDFAVSPRLRARLASMDAYFRAGLRWVDRLTVQGEHMKRRLVARWGIAPERVEVVPSAVDPTFVGADPQPPVNPGYVCYVAAATPHKNHRVLADMMSHLSAGGVDLRCKVTVTREEAPDLTRAAERQGVLDRFDFLGSVSHAEARSLIRGAQVVVLPSKLESFGLPCYEAMALGVPLVVADRDYATEACGEAAAYADADDGRQFADKVADVLRDREQWIVRGRQRHAELAMSWRQIAGRYLHILESLS